MFCFLILIYKLFNFDDTTNVNTLTSTPFLIAIQNLILRKHQFYKSTILQLKITRISRLLQILHNIFTMDTDQSVFVSPGALFTGGQPFFDFTFKNLINFK
jgi:hypothetical protein